MPPDGKKNTVSSNRARMPIQIVRSQANPFGYFILKDLARGISPFVLRLSFEKGNLKILVRSPPFSLIL